MFTQTLLFVLAVGVGHSYAATLLSSTQMKQAENILNLAEKMSNNQHRKYCQRFGDSFANNPSLPEMIRKKCIETLVFNTENRYLPENFPAIDNETSKKVVDIHTTCFGNGKNPCIEENWNEVKSCIRTMSLEKNLMNVGSHKSVLPKNLGTISVGISASVSSCTEDQIKLL